MFLQSDLGSRQKPLSDGEQPGFAIVIAAAINGNGFKAKIDGGQMGA